MLGLSVTWDALAENGSSRTVEKCSRDKLFSFLPCVNVILEF